MKKNFLLVLFILIVTNIVTAQEDSGYQVPPDAIVKIVDAPPTPSVSISPDKMHMVIIDRPPIITIKELSQEELRIAGLRINPATNGPSRQTYNKGFNLIKADGSSAGKVTGLPANPSLGSPEWSPDGSRFAFTNTTEDGIELWICELATLKSAKIDDNINMVFGSPVSWLSDSRRLIYSITPDERGKRPERSPVPAGPVIQENLGVKGQAATYQDLLKDPVDEALFEYFATNQVMLWNGESTTRIGRPAMIASVSPSPDGNYLMVNTLTRPFSYIVPYFYFPTSTQIWDMKGNLITTLLTKPLTENLPRGYDVVMPGRRSFGWRADKPAQVYWVEALDGGDFTKEMDFHDQVYVLDAPFTGEPVKFIATSMRYSGITWGDDDLAIIAEGSSKTRIRVLSTFSPVDPVNSKKKIQEFNSDDRYNNPGRFMTGDNSFGRNVLLTDPRGRYLFLSGSGSSPQGDMPFIDRYEIKSGKTERMWQCKAPYYEVPSIFTDTQATMLITNRQSVNEVPNYFLRNLKSGKVTQITYFENPYPQLAGVHKELVSYKRSDGLDLSFTLYLPAGYDKVKDGPLPTLLWAYPREFNDISAAGQVSGSPYTFTRISPASALVYVTCGYAVLMDASFPIVGTGGKEPNDTFVEQLVANAEAAINKAVEMGVTDRSRVAVSGHSYGAFMTANLLAHSRLFAAGIAESGAYNRTLTPFGFQNERRSYWEAPQIYNTMSPFMNADKVKDPLMLIHGMADNNSGTFPIQSERFYAALKGFGAVTRLIMLPMESHGYAARETILHKHWEVLTWMDKYVKNKK